MKWIKALFKKLFPKPSYPQIRINITPTIKPFREKKKKNPSLEKQKLQLLREEMFD